MTEAKPRTLNQNAAVHLWFQHIAETLNDAGYEQKLTVGTVDCPWNAWSVKALFRKIASFQFGKAHTSDLTTKELTEAVETLHRYLANQGVDVAFPSVETLIRQQDLNT